MPRPLIPPSMRVDELTDAESCVSTPTNHQKALGTSTVRVNAMIHKVPNVSGGDSHGAGDVDSPMIVDIAPTPPLSFWRQSLKLVACVLGIYLTFLTYGVLQESIYSRKYGPGGDEPFTHAWFLVLIQVNGNIVFAALCIAVLSLVNGSTNTSISTGTGTIAKTIHSGVPRLTWLKLSFSYIFGMLLSNWALSYLSYPSQSLAKSCKLIPVMLMRIVIVKARYEWREYLQVALITAGITIFLLPMSSGNPSGDRTANQSVLETLYGVMLCLLALALDGYTGPTQEKCYMQYHCTIHTMMLALNGYSAIIVAVVLAVTGELFECVGFVAANPRFLYEAATFALCSSLGQLIILYTLQSFNSLVLVTITTTRKFVTILLSIILYSHELVRLQWLGVLLVFTGLLFDIQAAYRRETSKDWRKKSREEDGDQRSENDSSVNSGISSTGDTNESGGTGADTCYSYLPLPQSVLAEEQKELLTKAHDKP